MRCVGFALGLFAVFAYYVTEQAHFLFVLIILSVINTFGTRLDCTVLEDTDWLHRLPQGYGSHHGLV